MLLYIQSVAYPGRTFVDICKPSDTVARVRAYLLHRLHEIGHSNHQFRLKYKGTYLRDAYTLEEYKLLNNAVIHMVPLNDVSEWNKDMRFHQLSDQEDDVDDIVQNALKSEVKLLDVREKVLKAFKIVVMMQILMAFMALFTNYWYFFFAYGFVLLISYFFAPSFTRVSGWVGTNSVRRKEFMIVMLLLTIALMGSGIALLVLNIIELLATPYPTERCLTQVVNCFTDAGSDEVEQGVCLDYQRRCYETSVWTTVYYSLVILFMVATGAFCSFLLHNFKFNPGDYIERYLIQTRDLQQILDAARSGSSSQKRGAAFELATMASSADDNKFEIVAEGGLEVLISLALSPDLTTQEYASEAIAECLTIPAIQDQFVEIGGMKTLTVLLNAKNPRTNFEAILAISYVTSDSDDNKLAVVAGHGLDDLLYICKYANANNRKILASIYLELASFSETRSILGSRSAPAEALLHLLDRSSMHLQDGVSDADMETIQLSLQAFELLAIEAPTLVSSQEELLPYLLGIANSTVEAKIQLLAGKLLLYYTQTPESLECLLSVSDLTDKLLYFAHSSDAELLKVLANISFQITQPLKHRERLLSDGFNEFLMYLQNSVSDRETWTLIDQAIANLQSKDNPNDEVKKAPIRPTSAASTRSATSSLKSAHVPLEMQEHNEVLEDSNFQSEIESKHEDNIVEEMENSPVRPPSAASTKSTSSSLRIARATKVQDQSKHEASVIEEMEKSTERPPSAASTKSTSSSLRSSRASKVQNQVDEEQRDPNVGPKVEFQPPEKEEPGTSSEIAKKRRKRKKK